MTEEQYQLELARVRADAQERLQKAKDTIDEKIALLDEARQRALAEQEKAERARVAESEAKLRLKTMGEAYRVGIEAFREFSPRIATIRNRQEPSNARELQRLYRELETLAPEFLAVAKRQAAAMDAAFGASKPKP